MWLWRPRSPIVCPLHVGEPSQESQWHNSVQVQMPKNQELQCLRTGKDGCPSPGKQSEFSLILPFSSIWAIQRLDAAHPHWWGWMSLLSLLNQMLSSSIETLTDTHKNNVLPAIQASLSPGKLTHKINHHNITCLSLQIIMLSKRSQTEKERMYDPEIISMITWGRRCEW